MEEVMKEKRRVWFKRHRFEHLYATSIVMVIDVELD